MSEDTVPLFEDDFEIEDWARNNMDWDDVKAVAYRCGEAGHDGMQDAWVNPVEVEIIP